MDYSEIELGDPDWATEVKELPTGGAILNREAKKALDGEDFKYFPSGEKKQSPLVGVTLEVWNHYSTIFRVTEEYGLPHGDGWANELPWLISLLMEMRYTKQTVKFYYKNKALGN
jgi:hypothetical protein